MRIVHAVCVAVLLTTTSAAAAGQPSETSDSKNEKNVPVIAVPSTSAPAGQQSATRDAKSDKIICKRTRVTGSLASSAKVCGTRHWWEQRARHSQEWAQEFQENSRRLPPAVPGT